METIFERSEMRTVSEQELIYTMTQSKQMTETSTNEKININGILESMTPGRRSVAMAAIELYKRSKENVKPRQQISCPNDVYNLMFNLIAELEYEEFWALYLTQAGTVIKRMRIGAGGIDGTYADVRLILRYAIECNATQLCICHNHPSGNTRPSRQDINLTQTVRKAAELMNIRVFDHLIIADGAFYSFSDEGTL